MRLLLAPLILLAAVQWLLRRPKWDDATWKERLLRGEMSDKEKLYRGIYPYHLPFL